MSQQNFHDHHGHGHKHSSSAGQSNVGFPSIYGDDDQRNVTLDEVERTTRESGTNLRGHLGNYSSM